MTDPKQDVRIRPPFHRLFLLGLLVAALGVGSDADSRVFHVFGNTMTLITDGSDTDGKSATISALFPPGNGPRPHIHSREDETYVVVRGQFRFWHGPHIIDASPGTVIYMPRGETHYFRNVGTTEGEVVLTIVPAGLERLFATISRRNLTVPKDREEVQRLDAEYGITYPATPSPFAK